MYLRFLMILKELSLKDVKIKSIMSNNFLIFCPQLNDGTVEFRSG